MGKVVTTWNRSISPTRTHEKKHADLPKRCTPIASSGKSWASEQNALLTSKYFIVVCSANVRKKPTSMDEELEQFLGHGADASRVLPISVSESSNPAEECFPKAVELLSASHTIVAANIHDAGSRVALLKLIAAMLGLRLEELESFEARRKKRIHRIVGMIILCIVLGIIAFIDFNSTKTMHYLDCVEVWGQPRGIDRLDDDQIKGMHRYFTITQSQGLIRELTVTEAPGEVFESDMNMGSKMDEIDAEILITGVKTGKMPGFYCLTRPETAFSKATYEYDENRSLRTATYSDNEGSTLISKRYMGDGVIDIIQDQENSLLPSQNITRLLVEYDEAGFVTEERYVWDRSTNHAISDSNGVFGHRYERDA